jgi:hypothetical protein
MATAVKDRGLVRTHVIVGWPAQVQAALQRAQADGRLIQVDEAVGLADRQVQVTAQFREDRPRRARRMPVMTWPSARVWVWLAVGVLGAAAVVAAVWLVVAAVTALIAAVSAGVTAVATWLSTYWPALAGIAVALALLGSAGGVKKCVGLHCGGCKR